MKKIYLISVVLCFFAAVIAAEANLSVFGGVTYVSMKAVNESITKIYGENSGAVLFGGGYMATADIGLELMPGFSIGPRVQYIGAFDASVTKDYVAYKRKATYGASLVPVMLGFQEMIKEDGEPLAFGFGMYLGYGFAKFSGKVEDTAAGTGAATTETFKLQGGGETAELFIRLDYKIERLFTLGFMTGYRRANATGMAYTEVSSGLPVEAGDIWKDASGEPMIVSFNGFYLNAGIVFEF